MSYEYDMPDSKLDFSGTVDGIHDKGADLHDIHIIRVKPFTKLIA